MATFSDVFRIVRLHCPLAPLHLVRFWTQEAYRQVCDRRPWSWLRSENEFLITAQKTAGTVTVTNNSAAVVGVGTAFAASDVGRQFRSGTSGPVYSIATHTDATNITIDRVYGGTTAAGASYTILDAYVTMPADFLRFISVLDTSNNWQLHLWITEAELNAWDAQRSSTGTPWALVNRRRSSLAATVGRAQYELWPYQTSAKGYPYYYIRNPESLADTDTLQDPLNSRSDILVMGAIAQCAGWPGLEGRNNPYFNPTLAASKQKEFSANVDRMEVLDEETYLTWMETTNFQRWPFAPIDAQYLQSHDVLSLAYGYGGFYG